MGLDTDTRLEDNTYRNDGGEQLATGNEGNSTREESHLKHRVSLLPYKVGFFLVVSSHGVISSFLPLYLKTVGLNPGQIGTVMLFRPLGGFFGGLLAPHISKKVSSDEKVAKIFACLFIMSTYAISFPGQPSFSDKCPILRDTSNITVTQIDAPIPTTVGRHGLGDATIPATVGRHGLVDAPIPTTVGRLGLGDAPIPTTVGRLGLGDAPIPTTAGRHGLGDAPIPTTVGGHGHGDRSWMFRDDTLWMKIVLYSILLFLSDFCLVGMDTIQHGVTMKSLGKENSRLYGTIRAWGALGYAAAAISTGLAIHTTVVPEKLCSLLFHLADYHFLFYTFVGFAILNLLNVGNLFQDASGEYEDGGRIMSHADFRKAICTLKTSSWLMVLLCRSVFYAVTQGFLNWHLENIGASPALIGSANCTTTTTEFIMFFATPKLIEIFGHTKLVAAGIISYVCRFIIFSLITNPLYILPVEVMEGVMFACIWSSVVSHLSNQVPEEGQTQVQGLIQALYMLGTGIGFPISGLLTQIFGAPVMFLVFAGLASVTFVAFVLVQTRD